MPLPRVSVVVPLYDKAEWIVRCLDSIAGQTFSGFEAIVVDDGSTDGGGAIVRRYRDSRFRLIQQANAGPGAARNHGVREAQSEHVAFLDADDTWLPACLETHVAILDRHPSVACVSGAWIEHPRGAACGDRWAARGISEGVHRISPATPASFLAVAVPFMHPPTTMVRADALRRWGGFQEDGCRFGEDGMLWLRLMLNSPVFFHLQPVAEIHRESSVLSGNYTGPRPVEPFLMDPDALRGICPAQLRPLLERFYAMRACKTACMFGYWGQWRAATPLVRRFVSFRDWDVPLFWPALIAGTPLGAVAGWTGRKMRLRPASAWELPAAGMRPGAAPAASGRK